MIMTFWLQCSPRINRWIDNLTLPLLYIYVLPLTYIYHTILFLLSAPPREWPHASWRYYVGINVHRTWNKWARYRRTGDKDVEEEVLPAGADKYLRTCELKKLYVEPIRGDVPRLGPVKATEGKVKPERRVSWMIRKWDAASLDRDMLAPAEEGERVIFFLIGGGYQHGHPLRIHTAWSLAELSGARVFAVNYRKSLTDTSAFPASLLDSLAGYQYLVDDLGFRPENILTSGDSAGANACLALSRYLGQLESTGWTRWGLVGAMCLHCPWSDMSGSFKSIQTNSRYDTLSELDLVCIPSHTRHFPSPADPYFSPVLTPSGGWKHLTNHHTRVYICGGTAEGMRDEILALAKGMQGDGVDLMLHMIDGMSHSDFVNVDRSDRPGLGWTWPAVRKDFIAFWGAWVNGTPYPAAV